MTQPIVLHELKDVTEPGWDGALAAYSDTTVFHLTPWLTCLEQSLPGSVVRFEILAGSRVCGHWCGFLLHKFGLTVFGAPLPGSATDYMYPLFVDPPPSGLFLQAVKTWARQRGAGMVDLGGEYFPLGELAANGYRLRSAKTYRVELTRGASEVWNNLKPAMRNKIRKAEKNGVVVSEDSSPEFPRRFYEMLQGVFARQGLAPTYGLSRVETLMHILAQAGQVVPLTAWRQGEPLGSLIVLLDRRTAYFWGGASYETAYPFGANDLLHWQALQLAVERGLTVYDTCGGGEYKTKFGGREVALPAGFVYLNPAYGPVRAAVRGAVRARGLVLGRAKRLRSKPR